MMRLGITAFFGVAAILHAAGGRCQTSPLSVRIPAFKTAKATLIQALLQLGSENGICFGVEAFDEDLLNKTVDASLAGVTAQEAVRRILLPGSGLKFAEKGGVVVIGTKKTGGLTWLDYTLPEFKAPQASRAELSNLLYMTLAVQVDPSIRGFAGHFKAGPGARIGPFHESGKSVRELLNLLVTSGSPSTWIAYGAGVLKSEPLKGPFWVILEYDEPLEELSRVTKGLALTPRKSRK